MRFLIVLVIVVLGWTACNKEVMQPNQCDFTVAPGTRFFEFLHQDGDRFIAWTDDMEVLAMVDQELAKSQEERGKHINGVIARVPEDCALNKSWSWYFLPDQWSLADLSIEVCDGNPDYVEENLQTFLDVGRFCPWGSIVLQEIEQPF